jgi:hypothetical protein
MNANAAFREDELITKKLNGHTRVALDEKGRVRYAQR